MTRHNRRFRMAGRKKSADKHVSGDLPSLKPIDKWRLIHELKRELASRGVEWDLSGNSVYLEPVFDWAHYDGDDINISFELEKGWTASLTIEAGSGSGSSGNGEMDNLAQSVSYDTLADALAAHDFDPDAVTWADLGVELLDPEEVSVSPEGDGPVVCESSIEVTSPNGNVYTADGMDGEPNESVKVCSISVTDEEHDPPDTVRGVLKVSIRGSEESIDGAFPFEAIEDFYECSEYEAEPPPVKAFTTDIDDALTKVILEGRDLLGRV
ncbi:hypothetical protein [Gemmatimonas sp.]|uniref:hypothetical protein n=2 Tax=Gemmatimonas sp. TaxID=1962908 RepID=UPI0035681F5D